MKTETAIKLNLEETQAKVQANMATVTEAAAQLEAVRSERAEAIEAIKAEARAQQAVINAEMKQREADIIGPASAASRELNTWASVGLLNAEDIPTFSASSGRGGAGTGKKKAVQEFLAASPEGTFLGKEIEAATGFTGTAQLLQTMMKDNLITRVKDGHLNRYSIVIAD